MNRTENPSPKRHPATTLAWVTAVLLLAPCLASCRKHAQEPTAGPPLEWPAAISLPSGMKLEGPIPWTTVQGPFFSNTFDRIVDDPPPPGRAQSMADLACKTILIVGRTANPINSLEGSFKEQGYHEIHRANLPGMRAALDQYQIDLVVLQMGNPEERAACGQVMMTQYPHTTFTTFQPEKGQKNLTAEAKTILGPAPREASLVLENPGIRKAFRDGELVGLAPADPDQPMLGLRPDESEVARRIEAFHALLQWVDRGRTSPE